MLFFPVIFFAAWVGGRFCGVFTTILSMLVVDYNFLPPYGILDFSQNGLSDVLFLCIGIGITALINRQKDVYARERKLKEESLGRKKMYDALLDATEDHVFMFDQDHRFIYLNRATQDSVRAALVSLGKNPNQTYVGKSNRELGYSEELFHSFEANLKRALSGETVKDELVHPSATGPRTFEYVLSPVYDSEGRVTAATGFTRDVHDRKLAEKALSESERRLKETAERMDLALKAGAIGIFEMDLTKPEIPVQWSDREYEIFGVDPKLGPMTYSVFQTRIHPDDLGKIQSEFEESVRERRDFNLTYRARMDDGGIKWVQASARTFYDKKGLPVRMIGTNIDVTETMRAQEAIQESASKFRELAESMPQIVWATDPRGKAYYYNSQWFEYLGIPPSEGASLDGWRFIHPEDQPKVQSRWAEAMQSRTMFQVEFRMKKRDGTYHWFLSRSLPIFNSQGDLIRWYGTLTNIDENKRVEEITHRALKAREEMLAVVSHDLRNPLGAILMSAAMLKRKTPLDGPFVLQQTERIQRSGQRMNDMIEDLLNLAKMESGNFTLAKREVCGCDVVSEAVEMMASQALEKNIKIETRGIHQPLQMSCDHSQILRVFANLIGNAVKFTPENGLIQVTAKDLQKEVLFSISDTGPGIAEHHIPHVFDRFWQAAKTQHMGTGLGLAISKGIIEAHGGRIWVNSRFGEGAQFNFTVPKVAYLSAA